MTSSPSGPPDRLSADPEALFVYGSLLFPEVMRVLLGRVPASAPASAAGWRIAAMPGRVYPALVGGEATAKGRLITGLAPREWRVLDAFEDDVYELRRLTLTDGRQACAYVCDNPDPEYASPHDWDIDAFERHHLSDYLTRCAAWRQKYEARADER